MRLLYIAVLGGTVLTTGCEGEGAAPPPPLEIASVTPSAGATGVETGVMVAVVFGEAIDPTTLTSQTLQVRRGGGALATTVSYEAATLTGRAAAPLLPSTTYQVEVTTGVRTPAQGTLSAAHQWSFTTRPWQATTVDTAGDVGAWPSLAVDATGHVHVSYTDGAAGDLKYAMCAVNCGLEASWQAASVDTAGLVGEFTSLAVDPTGRLHITYWDGTNEDLRYATCAANCEIVANWQAATVDATGYVGTWTSLAVDATGRLHVSYWDGINRDLKYATCATNCQVAANWQSATVDATGDVGTFTSLAVDATGRLHVAYWDATNEDLKYATCAASCAAAANWQHATVDATGNVGVDNSLAVDAAGRVHVSYTDDTNFDLKYATCAANCGVTTSWQAATVDATGVVGYATSLAVDARGRLHMSYFDLTNRDLKYATCAANCRVGASWQAATVDAAGSVGAWTSLAVDATGRLHVSYLDDTNVISFSLKYIE